VVWSLDRIDQRERPLDNVYAPTHSGAGVRIYIVDTGVDVTLSNFGGRASNGYTAFSSNYADQNGHGTHCAGTAASATYGVAKQALIVNVKVLGATGSGTTGTLSGGLAWILANGVTPGVVSASLGMLGESSVVTSYCEDLIDAGFTLVAAAGNDDLPACMHFPSAVPGVLSVVASNSNDAGASFNNYGACTDIFAPGVGVTSLQPGGGTATLQGTSMATPHAAGACALILQQMPDAHSSQVFATLFEQATAGEMSNTKTSPNLLLYVESDAEPAATTTGGGSSSATATTSSGGSGGGGSGSNASTASPLSIRALAPTLLGVLLLVALS
jgi:serine protease